MKKLTQEELQSLQKSIKDYNAIKLKLQEKILMDKYGKDSSINTQTGEVTKIKK